MIQENDTKLMKREKLSIIPNAMRKKIGKDRRKLESL